MQYVHKEMRLSSDKKMHKAGAGGGMNSAYSEVMVPWTWLVERTK